MVHFKGKRYSCSCPNGTCDMNCRMYRIAAGKPSNADRIRAMSDEELADYLRYYSDSYARYDMGWLDWLKQEVVDDA